MDPSCIIASYCNATGTRVSAISLAPRSFSSDLHLVYQWCECNDKNCMTPGQKKKSNSVINAICTAEGDVGTDPQLMTTFRKIIGISSLSNVN